MLQLAEEEARLGPLWAVEAQQGVLTCALIGKDAMEPRPPPSEDLKPEELQLQEVRGLPPSFGHRGSCQLHKLHWQIPIGALPVASTQTEELLREQLLLRNAQVMAAKGLRSGDLAAMVESWKQRALKLFTELVDAEEVERALELTSQFLAGESIMLDSCRKLADKAGKRRLADAVQAVQLRRAASDEGALPPPPPAALSELREPKASPPSPAAAQLPEVLQVKQQPAAAPPTKSMGGPAAKEEVPAPAGMMTKPAANPFARKREAVPARPQAHFLRDTLGGGLRRPAPPATPMGCSTVIGDPGEPPRKAARVV